jgi:hypothetical protein
MNPAEEHRWEETSRQMQFTQLERLRTQAEGWRNGLTGLTGLVVVVTVLKGRDDLANLPPDDRTLAVSLVGGSLLSLILGTLLAVRASFGAPGSSILLGGRALREWTSREVTRVRWSLWSSAVAFVAGVGLLAGALGVAWTSTEDPPGNLVKVVTSDVTVCGELASYRPPTLTVLRTSGDRETPVVIRVGDVKEMSPAKSC